MDRDLHRDPSHEEGASASQVGEKLCIELVASNRPNSEEASLVPRRAVATSFIVRISFHSPRNFRSVCRRCAFCKNGVPHLNSGRDDEHLATSSRFICELGHRISSIHPSSPQMDASGSLGAPMPIFSCRSYQRKWTSIGHKPFRGLRTRVRHTKPKQCINDESVGVGILS